MRKFPAAWLSRLTEIVEATRRRQEWSDVFAAVEPPLRPGQPPLLRLEKTGAVAVVPLDLRVVEAAMRTGQEGPLLTEITRAFLQVRRTAQRREPEASGREKSRH